MDIFKSLEEMAMYNEEIAMSDKVRGKGVGFERIRRITGV